MRRVFFVVVLVFFLSLSTSFNLKYTSCILIVIIVGVFFYGRYNNGKRRAHLCIIPNINRDRERVWTSFERQTKSRCWEMPLNITLVQWVQCNVYCHFRIIWMTFFSAALLPQFLFRNFCPIGFLLPVRMPAASTRTRHSRFQISNNNNLWSLEGIFQHGNFSNRYAMRSADERVREQMRETKMNLKKNVVKNSVPSPLFFNWQLILFARDLFHRCQRWLYLVSIKCQNLCVQLLKNLHWNAYALLFMYNFFVFCFVLFSFDFHFDVARWSARVWMFSICFGLTNNITWVRSVNETFQFWELGDCSQTDLLAGMHKNLRSYFD